MDGCGGQRSVSWPSSITLRLVFKVGLSLSLELTDWERVTWPTNSGILLSHLPSTRVTGVAHPPWFVTWLLGIQIQFLVLAWRVHYWTRSFDACFLNYKRERMRVTPKTPSWLPHLQRACCPGTLCLHVSCRGSPSWWKDVYCRALHCIQIDGPTLVEGPLVLICSCALGVKGSTCSPDVRWLL